MHMLYHGFDQPSSFGEITHESSLLLVSGVVVGLGSRLRLHLPCWLLIHNPQGSQLGRSAEKKVQDGYGALGAGETKQWGAGNVSNEHCHRCSSVTGSSSDRD